MKKRSGISIEPRSVKFNYQKKTSCHITNFAKVELQSAFWQIQLNEDSILLTTIVTPQGRYRWKRLPSGQSFSSAIFHRCLQKATEGIASVAFLTNDI